MFKRRTKRSVAENVAEFIYPRSGWRRAGEYIAHRISRLSDTPHRIALGLACGVFVCFSPLFGLHFLYAALLALVVRGNVLAAIIGTFAGNPVTFPAIAAVCYRTGFWILGMGGAETAMDTFRDAFRDAYTTGWSNVLAVFGPEPAAWGGVWNLGQSIMLPYFVGGLVWGTVAAVAFYFVTRPLIQAYQKRRMKRRPDGGGRFSGRPT